MEECEMAWKSARWHGRVQGYLEDYERQNRDIWLDSYDMLADIQQ
jgi:hypothetical protein